MIHTTSHPRASHSNWTHKPMPPQTNHETIKSVVNLYHDDFDIMQHDDIWTWLCMWSWHMRSPSYHHLLLENKVRSHIGRAQTSIIHTFGPYLERASSRCRIGLDRRVNPNLSMLWPLNKTEMFDLLFPFLPQLISR